MNMRFTDKVALVTGGSSGIGRATAIAFAKEGATVAVVGRRSEALAETVKSIDYMGGTASAITADVTKSADVAAMVETVAQRYGRLDIAFNNAGMFGFSPLDELDEQSWHDMMETNVTSVWLSMKYEIAQMKQNGGGTIVNTSSVFGTHTRMQGVGAYVASKAAVSALTRNAALENIRSGIRINAISPGAMDTTMSTLPGETPEEKEIRMRDSNPIGRVGSLDEAAGTVLWLSSADAGFAVGHDLVIDGGVAA